MRLSDSANQGLVSNIEAKLAEDGWARLQKSVPYPGDNTGSVVFFKPLFGLAFGKQIPLFYITRTVTFSDPGIVKESRGLSKWAMAGFAFFSIVLPAVGVVVPSLLTSC